jgi:methylated-DNA-protein-cysteine methyltransferase related protein
MQSPPEPGSFNTMVWNIVRQIPSGAVSTYGQIASMLPVPGGVNPQDYERLGPVWVGQAMHAISSQADPTLPWQRVINSQGGISLPAGSRLAMEQHRLLQSEGIQVAPNGRVPLHIYGWEGPDASWLQANGLRQPLLIKKPDPMSVQQLKLL